MQEKETYYLKLGEHYFTNIECNNTWGNKSEALKFPNLDLASNAQFHYPDARVIKAVPKTKYIMKEYDQALEYILKKGVSKSSRAGDTLSVFGIQVEYDISKYFPILTGRKLFPRSIFAELVWMLSGSTNVRDLEKLGSKIWTPWIDKKFEQENNYGDGELGPIYGWQMRNFGAPYVYRHPSTDLGFDQISYIINELKTNSTSRRIMWSLWSPEMTTNKVRLPACHFSFILNVEGNKLNGMVISRSCDMPIGAPANVIFYAALIYLLSIETGLRPGKLIHSIADGHIYLSQIQAIEEYLSRTKPNSPQLGLTTKNSIFDYMPDDFIVKNYDPLDKIIIPVNV